jgi:hypothetical protein
LFKPTPTGPISATFFAKSNGSSARVQVPARLYRAGPRILSAEGFHRL